MTFGEQFEDGGSIFTRGRPILGKIWTTHFDGFLGCWGFF